jgi:hypothetical protein
MWFVDICLRNWLNTEIWANRWLIAYIHFLKIVIINSNLMFPKNFESVKMKFNLFQLYFYRALILSSKNEKTLVYWLRILTNIKLQLIITIFLNEYKRWATVCPNFSIQSISRTNVCKSQICDLLDTHPS